MKKKRTNFCHTIDLYVNYKHYEVDAFSPLNINHYFDNVYVESIQIF